MLLTDTSNIWKIFRLSERRGANLGVVVEADRSYLERPVGRRGRKRDTHTHGRHNGSSQTGQERLR